MNKIIDIEIKKIDENYSYFKVNYINEEKINNLIYRNSMIWINNKEYNISRSIYNVFYLSDNKKDYYFSISSRKENQNIPTKIEEGLEDESLETKKRFEHGNYFMSKKEIENFINSYEYQELWNNVKRGKYFNMEE